MRPWTTPVQVYNTDVDLTTADIYLTFEQDGSIVLELTNDDVEITEDSIIVHLSQRQTGLFTPGSVNVQLRYVFPDGIADASNIDVFQVERVIKEGEI